MSNTPFNLTNGGSSNEQVEITGMVVTFSQTAGIGKRIVRVFLCSPTPRIIAFSLVSGEAEPASLWVDEIENLVSRARLILAKGS